MKNKKLIRYLLLLISLLQYLIRPKLFKQYENGHEIQTVLFQELYENGLE